MGFLAPLLARWPGARSQLSAEQRARLRRLRELVPPPAGMPHRLSRYVTVDVETSGLNMRRDRLLSIGAVTVDHGRIDLARCFDIVLRQDASSSRDNILVHRIGGQRQLGGHDPAEALLQFLEYAAGAPLVAFRALFDRTFLDRAALQSLGVGTGSRWIDLAKILPVLHPISNCRTMDEWLEFMRVRMIARHDALADALATAQMLQKCFAVADAVGLPAPRDLLALERAQQWFGRE
jgi:DNA polymerase-3 subunit epsilon